VSGYLGSDPSPADLTISVLSLSYIMARKLGLKFEAVLKTLLNEFIRELPEDVVNMDTAMENGEVAMDVQNDSNETTLLNHHQSSETIPTQSNPASSQVGDDEMTQSNHGPKAKCPCSNPNCNSRRKGLLGCAHQ
jgi:hypothetical protein